MQNIEKIILVILVPLLFSCARLSSKTNEQSRDISSLMLYNSQEIYEEKFAKKIFLQIQNELNYLDFTSGCTVFPKGIKNFSMKDATSMSKFQVFNDALNSNQYIKNKLNDFGIEYEVILSDELKKCSLTPWAMNFNNGVNWLSFKIRYKIIDGLQSGYKSKVSKIRIVLINRNYEDLYHINVPTNQNTYFKYDNNKIGVNIFINPSNQMGDYHHIGDDNLEAIVLDISKKSSTLPERPSIISSPNFINKISE